MRALAGLGLSAVLGLAAAGCAGKNINRDLGADSRILVRQWTIPTSTLTEAGDHGFEVANPLVHENTLIYGSRAGGLTSLYPTLQQSRWSLPIPGGVLSEVALDRGTLYFGGGDGFLYSVNAENGRVNWRYDLHNPAVSRPVVEGGRLFVTTADDTVYAFDAGTGKWLWHYRRRPSGAATTRAASSPLVDGGEVLVGLSDGFLVSLNVADGALKWERKIHSGNKFTDVDARPVLSDGVLYVPSYDGSLYALKRQGGEILWRFDAGGSKQVVVDGERLYYPSSDGTIYALQKSNAKVLWKFSMDGGTPTQILMTEGKLVVGSSFQYLYLLDKKTGAGLYRFNAGWGSGFYGAPAYDSAARRLYVMSSGGNLYSFSARGEDQRRAPHGATEPYGFL